MACGKSIIPIKCTDKKVEVHQDDRTIYQDVSFEARSNADCNRAAGELVETYVEEIYLNTLESEVRIILWCQEGGITSDSYQWIL